MSASNDASASTAEGTAPAATTPSAASPTAQPTATGAQPTEEEQIVPDDEVLSEALELEYEHCLTFGSNLSTTQHLTLGAFLEWTFVRVPPNVIFEVDDIDEPWIYSRPFDYIHSRMMNSSISDWRQFIQKAYDNLTLGGYLELKEVDLMPESDDGTLPTDSALNKTYTLIGEALKVFGRPFQDVLPLVDMMKEVGFVDLYVKKFKWPTNTWPRDSHFKEIGEWANVNYLSGIEGWVMAPFTRALGWKKEEVQVLLIDVRKEFNDRNIHAYWSWYAIYGKKPEADTQ
ncbi:Secondary metabolism regulator LAE1 [Colletotrichum sp. SAR11_57]|nr:Secondary metabolism regulator LAE1 [Colletotrichum sp. SAR11_57]